MGKRLNEIMKQVRKQTQLNQEIIRIKRKREDLNYNQILVKEIVRKQRKFKVEEQLEGLQLNLQNDFLQEGIEAQKLIGRQQKEVRYAQFRIFNRIQNYVENMKDKMTEICIQKFQKMQLSAQNYRKQRFDEKRQLLPKADIRGQIQPNQISLINANVDSIKEKQDILEEFPILQKLIDIENEPKYRLYQLSNVIEIELDQEKFQYHRETNNEDQDIKDNNSQKSFAQNQQQNSSQSYSSESETVISRSESELSIQKYESDLNWVLQVDMEEEKEFVPQQKEKEKRRKFQFNYLNSYNYSQAEKENKYIKDTQQFLKITDNSLQTIPILRKKLFQNKFKLKLKFISSYLIILDNFVQRNRKLQIKQSTAFLEEILKYEGFYISFIKLQGILKNLTSQQKDTNELSIETQIDNFQCKSYQNQILIR